MQNRNQALPSSASNYSALPTPPLVEDAPVLSLAGFAVCLCVNFGCEFFSAH